MRENMYNSECSADLVLWLTSPVQGGIEVDLISHFAHSMLYRHRLGDCCRMEVK